MVRKWPKEHNQELHPKLKSLVWTEAYLSAILGPNILGFFDICLHWSSVVRAIYLQSGLARNSMRVQTLLRHSIGGPAAAHKI